MLDFWSEDPFVDNDVKQDEDYKEGLNEFFSSRCALDGSLSTRTSWLVEAFGLRSNLRLEPNIKGKNSTYRMQDKWQK